MTPLELYYQKLANEDFEKNSQQEQAMRSLQRVYDELLAKSNNQSAHWVQRLNKLMAVKRHPVQGVYLWGSVGVGKTWVMDTFYQALPAERKLRMHFHQFMQFVQIELTKLQGHKDPLKIVAQHFSERADIICFDEFLVNDIADAMILANLLAALFAEGITLVTTANVEPDVLYRNGLQRSRFLPAITLIKQYLEVVHLPSTLDYRTQTHELKGTYFYPLTEDTQQRLQESYLHLSAGKVRTSQDLLINGRIIHTLNLADGIAWFDFQDLCSVPRSQVDYLEIAQQFHTVFLSNVPHIAADQENTVRYLINLIDIFYDRQIRLFISAAVFVTEIYTEGRSIFEFRRTRSRLLEMQSEEYLQRITKK